MATTRVVLTPESAHFPASSFPQLTTVSATYVRPALAYDAAADETAYWTFIAPQGLTNALSAKIHYCMASATSGAVRFGVQVEAITSGDALDIDAGVSFDTANTNGETVAGTAGYVKALSVTLTNADSVAAGDLVRVAVYRDADGTSGTDDAAGDCLVLAIAIEEA